MKRRFFFFIILLATFQFGFSQQTRILFLGNSYTYVNDLPGTLSQLAYSLGDSIYYESNTPGGYQLIQHFQDPTSLAKIAEGGWDYVVLQAQSEEPSLDSSGYYYSTYPYAHKLDSLIHLSNPCAITMFYMTWGRKYGDSYWCPVLPSVCTFDGMNSRLRTRYLEMGIDNFAQVAPVGMAWKHAWQNDSSINLWSGDNSHPSVAGTYLTANVFYTSIFKHPTNGASYVAGLSVPQALFLQSIGSATVLDSINTWNLNQLPIHAEFVDTVNISQVQFYPNCFNATEFWWDFGDGVGYSALENSGYYYTSTGTYLVNLIASNQCYIDTASAYVTINMVGQQEFFEDKGWLFYPNPSLNQIQIMGKELENENYTIFNGSGEKVGFGRVENNRINIGFLAAGVYYLQLSNATRKLVVGN